MVGPRRCSAAHRLRSLTTSVLCWLQDLVDEVAELQLQQRKQPGSVFWGVICLSLAALFVGFEFFMLVVAKLLPPSSHPVLSWAQNDWYYCFLVPLTMPVMVAAVTLNWFSLKLFRHNS